MWTQTPVMKRKDSEFVVFNTTFKLQVSRNVRAGACSFAERDPDTAKHFSGSNGSQKHRSETHQRMKQRAVNQ